MGVANWKGTYFAIFFFVLFFLVVVGGVGGGGYTVSTENVIVCFKFM